MCPGGRQEDGQSLCSDGTQGLERQGDIGQSLFSPSFSREPVGGWTPVTKAIGEPACDLQGTGRLHRTVASGLPVRRAAWARRWRWSFLRPPNATRASRVPPPCLTLSRAWGTSCPVRSSRSIDYRVQSGPHGPRLSVGR